MVRTARLAAAAAALAVALAGGLGAAAGAAGTTGGTTTAGAFAWAPAGKAAVHPGGRVTMAGVKCVIGFVVVSGRRVYLAVPASCTGVSDGQATDGCKEAQVPYGIPVTIAGARHPGTLVYSSYTSMQLRGEKRPNRCSDNCLALVRLDRRDITRTNPSVPVVGGPTGVSRAQPSVGDQLTVLLATPTKAQAVATGNGGWSHTAVVDGQVDHLAVGSPSLDAAGRALGMVTVVPQQGGPGETTVTDLYRELNYLRTVRGFHYAHLARGTVPFRGPALLAL